MKIVVPCWQRGRSLPPITEKSRFLTSTWIAMRSLELTPSFKDVTLAVMIAADSKQISEQALMQMIAARNQDALMQLYRNYGNLVYSLALRVVRQPVIAEEITQDVFVKLWQKPERWNPAYGQFSSWLLTLTRNAAIDRLRREGRHSLVLDQPEENEGEIADLIFNDVNWFNGQILRRLLQKLPDEQRQLIELAFYGGHTHSDLAERLELPLGTVKTRLRLGLQKLKVLWVEATAEKSLEESTRD